MILGIYKLQINEINSKNEVCNCYFGNSIKAKKLETKTILIDGKNHKDLVIYFTRYVHNKSITILRLYYEELIGKIEKHEGKKYLMVGDYMQDIVLDKIKKLIGIEKFDSFKILIDIDDKFPDGSTFKNVAILITCVIKNDGKLYPQIFLEKALFAIKAWHPTI